MLVPHTRLGDTGNPEFMTVLKLMKAMGFKLSALPIEAD